MLDGDAVVRPCYTSSPSVHRLLQYLERLGFTGTPRFLGPDGSTELLGYIEGDACPAGRSHAATDEDP